MEERSGSFLPELPYTNRGVIRQKEKLSALIDWCQITVKEVPLGSLLSSSCVCTSSIPRYCAANTTFVRANLQILSAGLYRGNGVLDVRWTSA